MHVSSKQGSDHDVTTIGRRTFIKWALGAGLATTLATSADYSVRIAPQRLVSEQVVMPIPGLPSALEGLRVVQLSDLHLYPYTDLAQINRAVRASNAWQPDIVVLTGDYIFGRRDAVDDLVPALAKLNARYGVYAIYGNHDVASEKTRAVVGEAFARESIPLLTNQAHILSIAGVPLCLVGLDDALKGTPDLPHALHNCPTGATTILLAHEPDVAVQHAPLLAGRPALQLSGHTHGGQVRLPWLGAPLLPRLGQRFDAGAFMVQGMPLYVTRGVGTISFASAPAVRFNCPPEVSCLTLV